MRKKIFIKNIEAKVKTISIKRIKKDRRQMYE
jgi:hypothetical protein